MNNSFETTGEKEIMTIVCGTDFTKHATEAANVAAAVAHKTGDAVLLLHAITHVGLGAVPARLMEAFELNHRDSLDKEAKRLRGMDATVKEELLTGLPDEAILQKIIPGRTRLVVVGSLGHRSAERWTLGSISEHLAEKSPVATLVVRNAEPFLAWTRGERALKVFCAWDFKREAEAAVKWLKELQAIGPCEIVVGHVDSPLEEKRKLGLQGPFDLTENPPEVQRFLEVEARERVCKLLGESPCTIRISPCLGKPDFGLIETAVEEQADLMVTGTRQTHGLARLWHLSVSRGLLHYAPMSVLVVPAEPAATEPKMEGLQPEGA